ncbi:MAG TPA: hypothetical protein VGM26_11300 [Rhizomicrobium sp.]|jgi:hypothetical protein
MFLTLVMAAISAVVARLRHWLTFRRVLGIVVFLVLLLSLRELILMGADLSLLFGLDLGLVAEVSALMIILSVRHYVMTAAYIVRRGVSSLRSAGHRLRRGFRRAFRRGSRKPCLPPASDSEPGVWARSLISFSMISFLGDEARTALAKGVA